MTTFKRWGFRKAFLLIAVAFTIIFLAMQLIRPNLKNPPVTGDIKAPANVEAILRRACYDCHSNETNLRWYDKIAPVYWQVATHVKDGRKGLNFSEWNNMAPADQKAKLWEAVNQIVAGAMPLSSYEVVHSTAKISDADLTILKAYVSGMAPINKQGDTARIMAAAQQIRNLQIENVLTNKLPTALNGITYIPDYKNWQAISTTDRYDNGTMRVIFGNDIAIAAIKANKIHPWPNGTMFAKVAWDQVEDDNGNVTTGAFKQVEFMIKDAQKYATTVGWGFARFKTLKLLPYGKTSLFTAECVNCHQPQKDEDFVFTQPIKN